MTGEKVEKYIKEVLEMEPRHDVKALAYAFNEMAGELNHEAFELMELLLYNVPINSLMTHSYGFHTANGREIINNLKEKYYEYEKFN